MKKVLSLISQDVIKIFRNNIILYTLLTPVIVSFGLRLFFPAFDQPNLYVAVGPGVSQQYIRKIQKNFLVEYFRSEQEIKKRVMEADDTVGIVIRRNFPVILFEGNESAANREMFVTVIGNILSAVPDISFNHIPLASDNSFFIYNITIIIILISSLMAGLTIGFLMVEDKETKIIKALAVSPLTLRDYFCARGFLILLLSFITAVAATVIFYGVNLDWKKFIITLTLSTFSSLAISFVLALFADNQITAIGLVKIIIPVYLSVPVIAAIVQQAKTWFFYLLPNYWLYILLEHVLAGESKAFSSFYQAALLFFLSSSIINLFLLAFFKKRLYIQG